MDFSTRFNTGFFNTVQYDSDLQDDSVFSRLEAAADVCRAPSRWVATEIWSGGKTYTIHHIKEDDEIQQDGENQNLNCEATDSKSMQGIQKVVRILAGLILSLPGQVLALALMGAAFIGSEEIRLKHKMSVRTLSEEERQKVEELIQKRQELAKERQGCEPVSCILCSICCLLCCLVCQK